MVEWISAGKLPEDMMEEIKNFISSSSGKKLGFTSQSQVFIAAVREFLVKYKYITDASPINIDPNIELVSTVNNQIILKDLEGAVIVQIDENNKLMCYKCKDDPHDNKYIDFVSQCKELWPFLKEHNVKYVIPRDDNNAEIKKRLT